MRPTIPSIRKQKGVALFAALIALVIILIATLSLVQSVDTAQMISGNLAVRRDLTHETEIAMAVALANFQTGYLATEASREGPVAGAYYSPTVLPSNTQGIPTALIAAADCCATNINNTTYAFVIDRMCPQAGPAILNCLYQVQPNSGPDAKYLGYGAATVPAPLKLGNVIYRITVRVTDLRGTQTYAQTTLSSFGTGS